MKRILVLAGLVITLSVSAQYPKDKQIIDKLCGCFEVSFKYAETFSPDADYKYHEREETGGTAELALPIEVTDRKVVIQHLLVVSPAVIVKHWREEWTYEDPVIWKYTGDKKWVKETVPADQVKGKWTQTVWEVSDEPRYQGYSQFVNLDERIIWQNTADAPLPRREYSVRSDYNILKRTNRLNVTDSGYIHEQDNQKIIRKDGVDQLLVEEKGINSYKRLNDKECAAAKEYWEKYKDYWAGVRKAWAGYLNTRNSIQLHNKVEGRMLHEYLLELAKDFITGKIKPTEIDEQINKTIAVFLIN